MNKISYGFGAEYLESWTIQDALREIFQNYIDYGKYEVICNPSSINDKLYEIQISNDYNPDNLEFLRIGNSDKGDNENAIGHHGEGLKAAFLIMTRTSNNMIIYTDKFEIISGFDHDTIIGDTLYIAYTYRTKDDHKFITKFNCPKYDFDAFIQTIIKPEDIIFSNTYGSIVNKPSGNIYSGGLYVCSLDNMQYAYDINPRYLTLDRDRRIPYNWDIEYATGNIVNDYHKSRHDAYYKALLSDSKIPHIGLPIPNLNAKDYNYHSVNSINYSKLKAKRIDNKLVYIDGVTNEIIINKNVIDTINKHKIVKSLNKENDKFIYNSKKTAAKNLGVATLIRRIIRKYCTDNKELRMDLRIILDKLKSK